ncbi:MAG TPA: archease [Candidatus Binataceae bacterium]|nr:archease [Candidatus Binataceae bacterium]
MSDDDLFREFEHTGDLGIELDAPTRQELFARALIALSHLMVEQNEVRVRAERSFIVAITDDAEMLHDTLSRALTIFLADGFIWNDAAVIDNNGELTVTLKGESFDPKRHQLVTELKAVTYHQLAVEHQGDRWRARIVFDV